MSGKDFLNFPEKSESSPQPHPPLSDKEVEGIIERLKSRKITVDDGNDGRGGYFSHQEPDPLCASAASLISRLQQERDALRSHAEFAEARCTRSNAALKVESDAYGEALEREDGWRERADRAEAQVETLKAAGSQALAILDSFGEMEDDREAERARDDLRSALSSIRKEGEEKYGLQTTSSTLCADANARRASDAGVSGEEA